MKTLLALLPCALMASSLSAETLSVTFGASGDQAATYGGVAVSPAPTQDNSSDPAPILTVTGLDIDGVGGNDDSVVLVFSIANSTEAAELLSAGYRYDPGDQLTYSITSATLTLGNGTTTHQIDAIGFTSVGNNAGSTVATVTSTDPGFTTQTGATGTISLINDLTGVSNVTLENTGTANGRARNIVAAFEISTISLTPVAPVSLDDSYEVDENTTFTILSPGVLTNDTDGNGDPITAQLASSPTNGTLTSFSSDGSFVYQPNADFTGIDTFTYEANDDTLTGNVATVTLTVVGTPVTIPHIFQDNMVLQRNKPIVVWGWGPIGKTVAVTLSSGQSDSATVDAQGRWQVSLTAMPATNGPLSLSVNAPGSSITRTNIAVGDVWFCSGQSNAGWSLSATDGGDTEVAAANYPNFRLIRVPRYKIDTPSDGPIILEDTLDWDADTGALKTKAGTWFTCSPSTAGYFGAAFYYMGKEIHTTTDIPIGIIQSAYAGTPVEAWASSTLPEAHLPGSDPADPHQLYNGMVYPYLKLAITGASWYQGERNHDDGGHIYGQKLSIMINDWRSAWAQGDFPFYYMQIPPVFQWRTPEETDPLLPNFWEAQAQVMDLTTNAYMVVISDTSDGALHPKNKAPAGKRMGIRALKNTYGYNNLVDSGPIFNHAVVEGNQMRLHFDHADNGLAINPNIGYNLNGDEIIDPYEDVNFNGILDTGEDRDKDGILDILGEDINANGILDAGEDIDEDGILDLAETEINFTYLRWFEIAGPDGVFTDATAVIDGSTVLISAPSVPSPVAFRYAWSRFAIGNLMNTEGLPARMCRLTPPFAGADHYTFPYETERYIPSAGILNNDLIASSLLPIQRPIITSETSNGTLMLRNDGAFIYTPNTGFSGTDSFTYVASDGVEKSPESTVTLQVFAPGAETGTITREVWTDIGGVSVVDLLADPSYPDSPNETGTLTQLDAPRDWGNSYGQRIHGYIHPPTTGNYTFWVSSAAQSKVFLSTDDTPDNAVMICQNTVSLSGDPENWTNASNQMSAPVALVAGQRYYIQVLHKDGGSSDHCSVAWDLTQPGTPGIIIGAYLSEYLPAPPVTTNYADWSSWYGVSGDEFMLDFAFNLDPTLNSHRSEIMTPSTGTSGLPYWELMNTDGLVVEYLRRKNDLSTSYKVQFSDNLSNWIDSTALETVTPINDSWERVTVEDDVDMGNTTKRFGRVIIE